MPAQCYGTLQVCTFNIGSCCWGRTATLLRATQGKPHLNPVHSSIRHASTTQSRRTQHRIHRAVVLRIISFPGVYRVPIPPGFPPHIDFSGSSSCINPDTPFACGPESAHPFERQHRSPFEHSTSSISNIQQRDPSLGAEHCPRRTLSTIPNRSLHPTPVPSRAALPTRSMAEDHRDHDNEGSIDPETIYTKEYCIGGVPAPALGCPGFPDLEAGADSSLDRRRRKLWQGLQGVWSSYSPDPFLMTAC
jgi:hypothetical protein